MKKILLLFVILFISVLTTACINNFAVQELNNKAEEYMSMGDSQTAICRLKSSLDIDEDNYLTHYNLAVAYNAIQNYKSAIDELKKTIELKPEYTEAYYTMGLIDENFVSEILSKASINELSNEELSQFLDVANEAVGAYKKYLLNKIEEKLALEINDKITRLNSLIDESSVIFDKRNKNVAEE